MDFSTSDNVEKLYPAVHYQGLNRKSIKRFKMFILETNLRNACFSHFITKKDKISRSDGYFEYSENDINELQLAYKTFRFGFV